MKKLILSLALLFSAFAAQAVGVVTGVVSNVYGMGTGHVAVQSAGTPSGTPSCASGAPGRFTADSSTNAGRHQISLAEQAAMLRASLTMVGTGACTRITGIEDLDYLYLVY